VVAARLVDRRPGVDDLAVVADVSLRFFGNVCHAVTIVVGPIALLPAPPGRPGASGDRKFEALATRPARFFATVPEVRV